MVDSPAPPQQSHSTSLSPNLSALSPRTPDDAIFTQRRPDGSGNSGRSVSSMRRRVASGAAVAFSRSLADEAASPPVPLELGHARATAEPISSLPGFSEAVNGARKPSALALGAAFGQRVRSLAVGWTAGTGTDSAAVQSSTSATSWLRGRLSSSNVGAAAQRDAALLPPISLDSQSSLLRDSGAVASVSKRSFVRDEKDEPVYSDDDEADEPEESIRVIQAGNIMLEQSVYADPADWTSPPRFKHASYPSRAEGSDIGAARIPQSPSQTYVEPRVFADGEASQLTRRESRFKEVWTPDAVPRSALSATSSSSMSQVNVARATLSPHSRPNSFITAPVTSGSSVTGTSTYSLVAPSTASTALAEMGASLRWSQKFPEGTHMSRARSSRLSVAGLAGGLPAARMSGIWSEKDKEKGAYGEESLQIPTLTYNDTGSEDYANETKSSRRGSIMRSFGRRKSTTSRILSAETRNALRFLAKRREEVEDDSPEAHARGVGAPLCQEEERVAKWNTFKWVLFVSVIVLFLYGMAGLIGTLLTWSRSWERADVSIVVDTDILIFLTLASFLCVLTAVVGISGAILNSRPILSLYAFLLWPTLLSILVVGYSAYKRENLRLDRKLNMAWSRYFDDLDRLRLQNNLKCCGFYTPLHQATFSRTCYPRTALPGCKGKLYRYERTALRRLYTCIFSIVFVHLANISVSLLCSNHVNATFGKGLTPRAYRLDMTHVRRNALGIMRALRAAQEHVDVAKATSDSGLLRPPNAAAALDAQHRGMHDEKNVGDASFTSVELDESHRSQQPQGLVARSLAALRPAFHDRPTLPPKSPRRLETYAFTTPQAAIASNDVRGLGFVVSLNHGQARVLQDQHLGRASH